MRDCRADEHCLTCGDVAVEMRVLALDDAGLARCACEDGEEQVDVALVEPVHEGDAVLVHAGVALVRVP